MLDIENFKISCSQIADLLGTVRGNRRPNATEVKKLFNTLGRDYGELSEAQKFAARQILWREINYEPKLPATAMWAILAQIYAFEMYGKSKLTKGNESPMFLEKGNMAEPESIKFLSKIDGIEYQKNETLFENKWFKGKPDIIVRDEKDTAKKIIEVKTSYDLPSFIVSMVKPEPARSIYETMGYMDLLGCKEGEIVHVLVDMPEKIASFQKKKMMERYEHLGISPEMSHDRIGKVLADMEYSGIPDEYKIFRRPIEINGLTMKWAKGRVRTARTWFAKLDAAFTKKQVNLSEIEDEDQQEDSV